VGREEGGRREEAESSALVVGAVSGTGNLALFVSGGEPGFYVLRR
jgi:hypothetical protein